MHKLLLGLALIFLSFSVSSVQAQQLLKTFNDWSVFQVQKEGEKLCYIATTPKKKAGSYKSRGEPYLLVTHRSKTIDEVSVSAGYPYKQGSVVKFTVDKKTNFDLFTTVEVEDVAWAKDSAEDEAIVEAMKKGYELVVKANSQKDSNSTDTYSLRGFTGAYKHMKSSCK